MFLGSWVEEEGMELFWDAREGIVAWLNVDRSTTNREGDPGLDDILPPFFQSGFYTGFTS